MAKIYVLHENNAWVEPLRRAFEAQALPFEEWFLDEGRIDLSEPPPRGVFYNRMSASAFTRGHPLSGDYTGVVLAWLEAHGRRVINTGRALQLELSKVAQYAALNAAGIRTPRTVAVAGREGIMPAAEAAFPTGPVILKPNRGGKGHGVQLFRNIEALRGYVENDIESGVESVEGYGAYETPVDGITLLQEYIAAPEPYIVRAEFIGGKFFYAVRVNTSQGFQLCPADACAVEGEFCPTGDSDSAMFRVLEEFDHPIIGRYERLLAGNGIEIAGIEFITDSQGEIFTYDINTNTNYNPEAEAAAGRFGMQEVARFLGGELARLAAPAQPAPGAEASLDAGALR